jgi:hypothetical protein
MVEQIAGMNGADPVVFAQLLSLRVHAEEWDAGRSGGHFWFTLSC